MTAIRHSHSSASAATPGLASAAAHGAAAGLTASLFMALFAMAAAATYQQTGFFTPMYHIASIVVTPKAMAVSMLQAASGHAVTWSLGTFLLGATIHMAVGATYGALFGVLIRRLGIAGPSMLIAGLVWAVIVFAFSSCVGLPTAAALFDAGYPISNMASLVGYPSFLFEHLVYGAALGILLMPREFPRR